MLNKRNSYKSCSFCLKKKVKKKVTDTIKVVLKVSVTYIVQVNKNIEGANFKALVFGWISKLTFLNFALN